jgi:hypothetical protein
MKHPAKGQDDTNAAMGIRIFAELLRKRREVESNASTDVDAPARASKQRKVPKSQSKARPSENGHTNEQHSDEGSPAVHVAPNRRIKQRQPAPPPDDQAAGQGSSVKQKRQDVVQRKADLAAKQGAVQEQINQLQHKLESLSTDKLGLMLQLKQVRTLP